MPRSTRLLLAGFAVVALVAAVVAWQNWPSPESVPPSPPVDEYPLPALSKTAFLNTGPEAKYVGIAVCKECHAANHDSYLLTAHSRALRTLDPKAEPADGTFQHKPSGRTYRVYRDGGEFRHEEIVRDDSREIARIDLPVRYLIGSGHFVRSYLVEVNGFLHESPLSWYASRKGWDMSPGYDFQRHWSFERPITLGCLACHAGRVEPQEGAVHRMTIYEQSIGCESCHGPGSLHAAKHRSGKHAGEDPTIVNPGRLSRADLESVCAVCHLTGVATTYNRGRMVTDFRPGLPLSDIRTDYRFDSGSDQMTVVGHMEQLRRSACYQKTKDLTCITCHDLHAREKPKDATAFYRDKCLSCHASQGCKLPQPERLKKNDDCAACHMPRGDTDIPHVAFTHHRIGKHPTPAPPSTALLPKLVPIGDVSHLSEYDRLRNLGLAYLSVVDLHSTTPPQAKTFRSRAQALLEAADRANSKDGATAAALAGLTFDAGDHLAAAGFAQRALDAKDLKTDIRADTLLILANCYAKDRLYDPAAETLEKLIQLRRYSGDWRMLGLCFQEQNQHAKALDALQQSLAIRPWRPDTHAALAKTYQRLGDTQRAKDHLDKAQFLAKNQQR